MKPKKKKKAAATVLVSGKGGRRIVPIEKYLTTLSDEAARKAVADLVPGEIVEIESPKGTTRVERMSAQSRRGLRRGRRYSRHDRATMRRRRRREFLLGSTPERVAELQAEYDHLCKRRHIVGEALFRAKGGNTDGKGARR